MMMTGLFRAVLEVMAVAVLLVMLVQDWRWRGIQWPLFPLLAGLLLGSHLTVAPWSTVLADSAINVLLIAIQVLSLVLYVRLRFHSCLSLYLGKGDVLFWLACAVYFSPAVFLLYHLASLVIALGAHLLVRWLSLPTTSLVRIPLAGYQAAGLALLVLVFWVVPTSRPFSDEALLSYLN
jgi:hypothetical protein